jgi:hypothetical protein
LTPGVISDTGIVLKNSIAIENEAIIENVNIRDYDDLINSELCSNASDDNVNDDDIDEKLETCHESDSPNSHESDSTVKSEGHLSLNSLSGVGIEGVSNFHTVLSNTNLIVNDIHNGGNYRNYYISGKKNDVYNNSKSEDSNGGTTDDTNSTI